METLLKGRCSFMHGNITNKTVDQWILRGLFVFGISLFAFLLRRPPIKDWLLVFLMNAVTNGIIDKVLVFYRILEYPTRVFPKIFHIHTLFDYLLYPTVTVAYNQLTAKDKPIIIFFKLFLFTIPIILIETWAKKNTGLIKYKKGWRWYHSFISLSLKTLLTRGWMEWIRRMDDKQKLAKAH